MVIACNPILLEFSFLVRIGAFTITAFVLFGMIAMFLLGRMIRSRLGKDEAEGKGKDNMLQTALFGLFGFLLAFTYAMSGNRYQYIRDVTEEESNAIGTAILRSDLYPDSVTNLLRIQFKRYLNARIQVYHDVYDAEGMSAGFRKARAAEKELWGLASRQSKLPNMLIPSNQMIPALNEMFDIGSKRDVLARSNIPDMIIYMLLILALLSSFIAGIALSTLTYRDKIIISCFVLFTSLIIYITLDLGRPFRGLIRASAAEQSILGLRELVHDVPE